MTQTTEKRPENGRESHFGVRKYDPSMGRSDTFVDFHRKCAAARPGEAVEIPEGMAISDVALREPSILTRIHREHVRWMSHAYPMTPDRVYVGRREWGELAERAAEEKPWEYGSRYAPARVYGMEIRPMDQGEGIVIWHAGGAE